MTETLTSNGPDSFPGTSDPCLTRAIELIWREATLLDAKDYEAWEELYTPEAVYVIPVDRNATAFDDVLNMVYDDARMRRMRVVRMTEGFALSAVDSATTVRTVSRFVPSEVAGDKVALRAAQILVAFKRGTQDIWAADVDYEIGLGATAADDRIIKKVIRLIDADAAVPAAGFLL